MQNPKPKTYNQARCTLTIHGCLEFRRKNSNFVMLECVKKCLKWVMMQGILSVLGIAGYVWAPARIGCFGNKKYLFLKYQQQILNKKNVYSFVSRHFPCSVFFVCCNQCSFEKLKRSRTRWAPQRVLAVCMAGMVTLLATSKIIGFL